MENESKKKIKNKVILYTVGEVLTANLVKDVVLGIKDSSIRGKSDASHENSVGYENINTRFNTKVHVNNFVVLHTTCGTFLWNGTSSPLIAYLTKSSPKSSKYLSLFLSDSPI